MTQRIIVGSDIGGVIIDRINDDTDTSFFGDNYLQTTEVPGAFEALRDLAKATRGPKGECNVFLVSKCGRTVEDKTRRWLKHHQFEARTDIPLANVRFCLRRNEKAPICADLGITDFVDDRLEVLGYLASVRRKFLFRPDSKEVRRFSSHLPTVFVAERWEDVTARILA